MPVALERRDRGCRYGEEHGGRLGLHPDYRDGAGTIATLGAALGLPTEKSIAGLEKRRDLRLAALRQTGYKQLLVVGLSADGTRYLLLE